MKDSKYFFRLWGINLKGHFTFFGKLIKKNSMIGYPFLVLGVLPVTCLSPITSLIKATTDFISRKELPEAKKKHLDIMKQALHIMDSNYNSNDIDELLKNISSYKKKTPFSTVSDSTRKLLTDLEGFKPQTTSGTTFQPQYELAKRVISTYVADKDNEGKGMYRYIADLASQKQSYYCAKFGLHSVKSNANTPTREARQADIPLIRGH